MNDNNQWNDPNQANNHNPIHDHNQHPEHAYSAFPPIPPEQAPLKHSGIGIASFVISLTALLLIVIGVIVAVVSAGSIADDQGLLSEIESIAGSYGTGQETEMATELMESEAFKGAIISFAIAGIIALAAIGLAFVGLILGIVSAASRQRRKTFGIIGIVLNALILLGTVGLFVASIALSTFSAV